VLPDLKELIADVQNKLQLNPWTDTGKLRSAPLLSFITGVEQLKGVSPAGEFRWRDCEPLLEQASALIDRALVDRTSLQLAGEKYATFTLDVMRTLGLVMITDQERSDKCFETPYLVSKSQCESQQQSLTSLDSQLSDSSNRSLALNRLSVEKDNQNNRAGWREYLNLSDPTGPPTDMYGQALGPYKTSPRVDMANAISRDLSSVENDIRELEMKADIDSIQGQRNALVKGADGAKAQQDWDDKNRQHLADRADVEKEILMMKLAMANVEWLLDFGQQVTIISPRYRQTLRDAYDRLKSVEQGMIRVYGRIDDAKKPLDPLPDLTDEASVDGIVAWTRRAGTWLAALTRRSHNYVCPISVKALAGANWDQGIAAKQWNFNVAQMMFDNQCYVRIRGIAGWVVGGDKNSLWTLDVQMPDSTKLIYEGGLTHDDNQGLIKCRISAVTSRASRLSSDIVGITSCYNACPIGDWVVRARDAFNPAATVTVDDIQLDLYLAVLPL
jgi:hypothetical protein